MNKLTPQNPDIFKQQQLRKHKALATGLFLLMVAVYVFCTWLGQTSDAVWNGYVRAFAEAGMVGALADWFAVTALFHHPLGIPIPHTNLIENRKQSIGDNLGGFVVSNFLNAATIRPYIQKLEVSNYVAKWLRSEKNTELLLNEVLWLLKDIIQKIDDRAVAKFLAHKSKDLLNDLKLNDVLAGGLNQILLRSDHERILNYILKNVREYVVANEELVRKKVKEESHFLIPGFVDNLIATKLTKGVVRYLNEIENDPEHKLRKDAKQQLEQFIENVKTDANWQAELQEIKNSLLSGDKINGYAEAAWKSLQASVLTDLSAERSGVKMYLKRTIREMVLNLQNDEQLRAKIDGWIRFNAYKYILKNTDKVDEHISGTVGNWEGKELSNKLELEVGKDLQFIRINGTLVGGLVGLLIHIITKLFEN